MYDKYNNIRIFSLMSSDVCSKMCNCFRFSKMQCVNLYIIIISMLLKVLYNNNSTKEYKSVPAKTHPVEEKAPCLWIFQFTLCLIEKHFSISHFSLGINKESDKNSIIVCISEYAALS